MRPIGDAARDIIRTVLERLPDDTARLYYIACAERAGAMSAADARDWRERLGLLRAVAAE